MSRYFLSPQARVDLIEIHDYIAADSPRAAKRFIDTLREKCELLARFPELGERRDDLYPSLRCFSVHNYAILYRSIEEGIDIVRVVSGWRDIDALFRSDT